MPRDYIVSLPPVDPGKRAEAFARRRERRERNQSRVINIEPYRMAFDTTVIIPRVLPAATETGAVSFSAASYSGVEGTVIPFTIERAGNVTQQLQVDWAITGVPSATPSAGQVRFVAGDLFKTVNVTAGLVTANEVGSLAVTVTALSDTDNPPTEPGAVTFSVTNVVTDFPPTIISTPAPLSNFIQATASTYDMTQHVSDDGASAVTYTLNGTLATGLSFNSVTGILEYDGVGPASTSTYTLTATDAVGSAESSSFTVAINGLLTIPATISVAENSGTTNLSSYVVDPTGVFTTSQLLENGGSLVSTEITYSHNNGSYTITGISPGTVTGLSLQVTY